MAETFVVIQVDGADKTAAQMAAIGAAIQSKMLAILTVGALPVMNEAKRLAPKKTTNLASSIHIESTGAAEVTVGTDVEYAAAQEFGWPKGYPGLRGEYAGKPYLRPALDTMTPAAVAEMNKAVAAIVSSV